MERSLIGNSRVWDGAIRILLIIFFCSNYWQLPNLFDPNSKRWLGISSFVLNDLILLKAYYVFITIGYSFFIVWFTLYAFSAFLPAFANYRLLFSVINGLIFMLFFVLRYKAFMALAAKQMI
jgi:hypothetical protein